MNTAALRVVEELKVLRERAVALAVSFLYLDPHADGPDDQATMFCSRCGKYGASAQLFVHEPSCLVGMILRDAAVLPESYIEYDLGGGIKGCVSHQEAAASGGIHRFVAGAR